MARSRRKAFTLVELLVVIVILAFLLALMFPVVSGVWQSALMTKCQQNLRHIFEAQSAWRAEHDSLTFAGDLGWQETLMPYVGNQQSVFICPCSPTMGGVTIAPQAPTLGFRILALPGATYDGEGIGGLGPNDYPVVIPLDESNIFVQKKPQADGSIRWELDDGEQPRGAAKHADDIFIVVYYRDGMPYKASKPKSNGSGSEKEYRYEFLVNGNVIVADWQAMAIHAEVSVPGGGASSLTGYGLSKGTYQALAGKVNRLDRAQFLVLDYPKPVADYNNEVGDNDRWNMYFIVDPATWGKTRQSGGFGTFIDPAATWQHYQALRHFGKANVLSCDGRVRALGPEDLYETSPAWWYAENR